VLSDQSGQRLRLVMDFLLVSAFDHHSRQILGSGVTDEKPAATEKFLVERVNRLAQRRDALKRWFARNRDVDRYLRVPLHSR